MAKLHGIPLPCPAPETRGAVALSRLDLFRTLAGPAGRRNTPGLLDRDASGGEGRDGCAGRALALAALILLAGCGDQASDIKADEQVLLFPSSAHLSEDGTT